MSLKELTAEKHKQAETTNFMKAVFAKKLPKDMWADFTYQKSLIYNAIEGVAGAKGILQDLPADIRKTHNLYLDYKGLTSGEIKHVYRQPTIEYYQYLLTLHNDSNKIVAHLYTWHMGDLYGGQMIKKIVPGPHSALEFKEPEKLKTLIREKLTDDMAEEANIAFDWAIKIFNDYDLSNLE